MKLYGSSTSPYVRHCRVVLAQFDVDYEFVETDPKASAEISPAKKVPYFEDDGLILTDSLSIVNHIRTANGHQLFESTEDAELYAKATTMLDTNFLIRTFQMMNVSSETFPYRARHEARSASMLQALEQSPLPASAPLTTGALKLACFLSWSNYRDMVDFSDCRNLTAFLEQANQWQLFADTAPVAE